MERYFKPKRTRSGGFCNEPNISELVENQSSVKLNLEDIVGDPGLRKPIEEFEVGIRFQIRREYLTRGPCQPIGYMYPKRNISNKERSFQDTWYKKFAWLEYSISKDAAFCFWCYLFRPKNRGRYANDAFTKTGFNNWKRASEKFNAHIGAMNSCHNYARVQFESFRDQHNVSNVSRKYGHGMDVACLMPMLDVARFLLQQGLSFHEHDELISSINRGNFLELLEWYSQRNENVFKVVNQNVLGNNEMISPKIQKELTHACALEITNAIIKDIGDNVFSLMVYEVQGISVTEQIGVVLRYLNQKGCVIERFLAVVQVSDISFHSLKDAIDALFAEHDLSLSKLRGQTYDGVSNIRGEFNGLESLVLEENPYARPVYCFSQELQSVLFAAAKENVAVCLLFAGATKIVNAIGTSCKVEDQLKQTEHDTIVAEVMDGNISSGKGENEDISLARPESQWESHYLTLLRLCSMSPSVLEVLDNMDERPSENGSVASLIEIMEDYEFVFVLRLMKHLLGITNELSFALQQRDQNIVQALNLIDSVKCQLQDFKKDGWQIVLNEVNTFCELNMIPVLDMQSNVIPRGRMFRYTGQHITYLHYYQVEIFHKVVDTIIQVMNNRFSEASTELLSCVACLDPRNSFSQFNVHKLIRLAALYPVDFSADDYLLLEQHLRNYSVYVRCDPRFSAIGDLGSLAQKMVETRTNLVFPLVYRLMELALVLPIANASIEREFGAMKAVKIDSDDKIDDKWMDDRLVAYIERDIFSVIEDEQILQRFQQMQIY